MGAASTKPRAVLAVECGEGENVAPRLLGLHFFSEKERDE